MTARLIRYPCPGRRVVPSRARMRVVIDMKSGAAAQRQTLDGSPSAGGRPYQIPNEDFCWFAPRGVDSLPINDTLDPVHRERHRTQCHAQAPL